MRCRHLLVGGSVGRSDIVPGSRGVAASDLDRPRTPRSLAVPGPLRPGLQRRVAILDELFVRDGCAGGSGRPDRPVRRVGRGSARPRGRPPSRLRPGRPRIGSAARAGINDGSRGRSPVVVASRRTATSRVDSPAATVRGSSRERAVRPRRGAASGRTLDGRSPPGPARRGAGRDPRRVGASPGDCRGHRGGGLPAPGSDELRPARPRSSRASSRSSGRRWMCRPRRLAHPSRAGAPPGREPARSGQQDDRGESAPAGRADSTGPGSPPRSPAIARWASSTIRSQLRPSVAVIAEARRERQPGRAEPVGHRQAEAVTDQAEHLETVERRGQLDLRRPPAGRAGPRRAVGPARSCPAPGSPVISTGPAGAAMKGHPQPIERAPTAGDRESFRVTTAISRRLVPMASA